MSRTTWLKILVSCVVVGLLYGLKGWYIAGLVGGRYPLHSAIVDMFGIAFVILMLRFLDFGIQAGASRLLSPERSQGRKLMAQITRLALLLVIAIPFLLSMVQFFPQRVACVGTPRDMMLPFQAVELSTGTGRLAGWYIPGKSKDGPIVLVTHGLGANKEMFLPAVSIAYGLGYSAFIVDFRAHGDSDGHVTTFGYREAEDIQAAVDWIHDAHPGRPIYAMGYSMGAAAILRVAAESDPFEKLVIDSTFAKAENVARASVLQSFGVFQTPAWNLGRFWGWLCTGVDLAQHRPELSIARIKHRPILLIHGTADELIPPAETKALASAAGTNAQVWFVPEAMHIGSLEHPDYRERIRRFFANSTTVTSTSAQ